MVEVIAPSRVRDIVCDLFAPLVRGGALLLGPKYPRGCTSGRCANESTGSSMGTGPHCPLYLLLWTLAGPVLPGLLLRWSLSLQARKGAWLHPIDLDLEM